MSNPKAEGDRVLVDFELNLGSRSMQARARIPAGPVRLVDLLPILHKFNDAVISSAVTDAEQEGRTVSCRAGCGACCRQIVPISEHEALGLLEWIETLPAGQQAVIRERFAAAVERLAAAGMLERVRAGAELTGKEETLRLALDYFAAGVPCPFLINESCSIHPVRPMKCREYLVTSPAENCAHPTAETIAMVELPCAFSKVLFHIDRAKGERAKWLPFILLFEWAAAHRDDPQPTAPGLDLFQQFLAGFVNETPDQIGEALSPLPS